jgi:hypothetical protein
LRIDTSSLQAQGGQRRHSFFNILRDIPGKSRRLFSFDLKAARGERRSRLVCTSWNAGAHFDLKYHFLATRFWVFPVVMLVR